MNSGIYQLTFGSGKKYVRRSTNVYTARNDHIRLMASGTASSKLQREYELHGVPAHQVLAFVHPNHLDITEAAFIKIQRPELSSLEMDITEEDAKLLISNLDLLKQGTSEHIKIILDLKHDLRECKLKEIDLRKQEEDVDREERIVDFSLASINDMKKTISDLTYKNEELLRKLDQLKMPWYKKLFYKLF